MKYRSIISVLLLPVLIIGLFSGLAEIPASAAGNAASVVSEATVDNYIDGMLSMLQNNPVGEETIEVDPDSLLVVEQNIVSDEIPVDEFLEEEGVDAGVITEANLEEELNACGYELAEVTNSGTLVFENEFASRRLIAYSRYGDDYGAIAAATEPYTGYTTLQYETIADCYAAFEAMTAEGVDVHPDETLDAVQAMVPGYSSILSSTTTVLGYDQMQKQAEFKKKEIVIGYLGAGITDVFNSNRLVTGVNTADTDSTDTSDVTNHDTGCCTVILDSTPDNIKVMPLRFYTSSKSVSTSYVNAAYWYGVRNCDILCTSTFFGDSAGTLAFLEGPLNYAEQNNIAICSSAGNQTTSGTKYYPNNAADTFDCLWIVGGVDSSFNKYAKTNYDLVDFAQIAVSIKMLNRSGIEYTANGTSMASPYLASVAAMLMASGKYTTRTALYDKLKSMSVDVGDPGFDKYFGWGVPVYSTSNTESTTTTVTPACATTGHQVSNPTSVTEGTCLVAGTKTGVCDICGETVTVSTTVSGHTSTKTGTVITAATCTTTGTMRCTCDVCGASFTKEIPIDSTAHTASVTETTSATCTADGLTAVKCSNCKQFYNIRIIPATGHTPKAPVQENVVAATCTSAGSYDLVEYCGICGVELTREHKTVPATGHNYVNDVCTGCGDVNITLKVPAATVTASVTSGGSVVFSGAMTDYAGSSAYKPVTGHGFVYISAAKLGSKTLTVTTAGRKKVSFSTWQEDGSYTYSAGKGSFVVRAWLSYTDDNGKTVYVYSDPVTAG